MPTVLSSSSATRRILIATSIVIPILGIAVGASIWRYEHALGKTSVALSARAEALKGREAEAAFWHEREAMNEYLLTADGIVLPEIAGEGKAFEQATADLGATPQEVALIRRARAGQTRLAATFESNSQVAGTDANAEKTAVLELAT